MREDGQKSLATAAFEVQQPDIGECVAVVGIVMKQELAFNHLAAQLI